MSDAKSICSAHSRALCLVPELLSALSNDMRKNLLAQTLFFGGVHLAKQAYHFHRRKGRLVAFIIGLFACACQHLFDVVGGYYAEQYPHPLLHTSLHNADRCPS